MERLRKKKTYNKFERRQSFNTRKKNLGDLSMLKLSENDSVTLLIM